MEPLMNPNDESNQTNPTQPLMNQLNVSSDGMTMDYLGLLNVNSQFSPQTDEDPYSRSQHLLEEEDQSTSSSLILDDELSHEMQVVPSDVFLWQMQSQMNVEKDAKTDRVECLECGKTYSANSTLTAHMRTHTGEKPFSCDECDAAFSQLSNLRIHKRVHTGERPYMCGVCGKTCGRSSHLMSHMRTHSQEKLFSCEHCQQMFATLHSLNNHQRVHTGEKPYTCYTCGASFAQSSTLSVHRKSHSGVKQHECTICGKRFAVLHGLKEHLNCHKIEKSFECDQCHKKFTFANYLQKHKKKHCGKDGYKRRWQDKRNETDSIGTVDKEEVEIHIFDGVTSEESERKLHFRPSCSNSNQFGADSIVRKQASHVIRTDDGEWAKAWMKHGYK